MMTLTLMKEAAVIWSSRLESRQCDAFARLMNRRKLCRSEKKFSKTGCSLSSKLSSDSCRVENINFNFTLIRAREKSKKRLEKELHEAELKEKLQLEEERQKTSSTKVREWMRKKEIQADKKIAKLNVMKKEAEAASAKPKEFKKVINFQDWLAKKNEAIEAQKKEQELKKKKIENYQKCRKTVSSTTYENWIRSSASKPKPVPMNKGLESLRGSTTKIKINPIPWESIDNWD